MGRWQLSRAGITNVYQYVDETLEFAGGRLLLRGVNGSGKSTAMNMLLPFLLEADTRRIDAAGEQSAVLRSWMLAGREEAQPVGYLWIEFERRSGSGDDDESDGGTVEHVTCGCGIKANRNTDRVNTWWFITDRRPGVDLALVDGRVPLGVDALRTELGPHAVFAHDQRRGYRQAVRDRLFGGRDLDQHIRLLHVVRNPRVGDRIDTELPEYLAASLPELSDTALDDAAQPLEDLEEHRRNVEALTRTATTLEALTTVYRAYAATELRDRATHLVDLCDRVRAAERDERRARNAADAAADDLAGIARRIDGLDADAERLRTEIEALEASPAYQEGRQLDDLRRHVAHLEQARGAARQALHDADERRTTAEQQVRGAASNARDDAQQLTAQLAELDLAARQLHLAHRPPNAPSVAAGDDPDSGVPLPTTSFDAEPSSVALGLLRSAARQRRDDVADVAAALDEVDRLTTELAAAEQVQQRHVDAVATAEASLDTARSTLHHAVDAWRDELRTWLRRYESLDPRHDTAAPPDATLVERPDLAHERHGVVAALGVAIDAVVDHRVGERERVAGRLDVEQVEVDRLTVELEELERRTHPEPPSAGWQRTDRRTCFADLIDFAPHLDDDARRGLEASMEAAGLLGAELGDDGALRLRTGELVVTARAQVDAPLSDLLVVTVPPDLQPDVDPGSVTKVLDAIATRHDVDADTVVTTDGRFRVGALSGRHDKHVAEHIGVTARRAALDRRRADLRTLIAAAVATVDRTTEDLVAARIAVDVAAAIRGELPRGEAVGEALQRTAMAVDHLDSCRADLDDAALAVATADEAHAASVTAASRVAATHQLPDHRDGLRAVDRTLGDVAVTIDRATELLRTVTRSHHHWLERVDAWQIAVADHRGAGDRVHDAESALEPERSRLATLEDSIGVGYQEVLESIEVSRSDLATATSDLRQARTAKDVAVAAESRARVAAEHAASDRARAQQRCTDALEPMRRALAVPGLLDATFTSEEQPATAAIPTVAATPDGVRQLADAVLAMVDPPAREGATAEGVRISLRQRRDQLGAGWDAEDHQPDDTLPLSVQVTGPLGRMPLAAADRQARAQLAQQAGLLTAKQDQALRNLLQGLVAREVAEKMHAAGELVELMNERLDQITTAHGIGVRLTWRRRRDLDEGLDRIIELLGRTPDLRTADHDRELTDALSARLDTARRLDPERRYRDLIGEVLDYRSWHELGVHVRRPGQPDQRLTRRTPLSEGEKKIVSYLPLFASVAASYDALAEAEPSVPRFVLLDDAFAKVSEDNHAQLFGLLVELDLDFIATSERLWGTHSTVPALAITEVLRDADLGVIVLEHSRWDGATTSGRQA